MYQFNGIGTTLYGKARKQELAGEVGAAAAQTGYHPTTYQAVKWFTFIFLPVVPLGTYRVIQASDTNYSFTGETTSLHMVRVPWDWRQVAVHYAIGYGWIPLLILYNAVTAP